jgi:Helicase conserved C-terminal domain
MTSAEVREELIHALRLDLIGPGPGHRHESEILPQAPSRWYLTGFLVPYEAPESQRRDAVSDEEIDVAGSTGATDDDERPERASGRKVFLPSSLGVSVLVPPSAEKFRVTAQWGDYQLLEPNAKSDKKDEAGASGRVQQWKRTQRVVPLTIPLPKATSKPVHTDVPLSGGVRIVTSVRPVTVTGAGAASSLLPAGTRSVSVFLVNYRPTAPDERKDEGFTFQAGIVLHPDQPFVPRPNLRGFDSDDPDERVADLQYRDVYECAVGHGVATTANLSGEGECREVATEWMPSAEVEKVEPAPIKGVELSMEALAEMPSSEEVREKLKGLVSSYNDWISDQRAKMDLPENRREVAVNLLQRASFASKRIGDGIRTLEDPTVFEAFRIANRTMAAAARQRTSQIKNVSPKGADAPMWRPFQLAFLLMNLRGIAEPGHAERNIVDLLFFPTGGGKTEAYLGLAAFTLVMRRLKNPGLASAGVSVLMRYTLRLLTLDQLGRAATLICALEIERQKDVTKLGTWPFEIGLWVGQAATPNRMGRKGDNNRESARAKTIAYQNNDKKPSPIPLENCPWCGTKFKPVSFSLKPNPDAPTDLRIVCVNRDCYFRGDHALPVLAVDDPIYRRLPCFLIATVDKFANLPWVGQCGALFGKVERLDKEGFYGPCDPGRGNRLEKPLPPPDLIVQDELHLISGPLGTMVGLYETAIDELSTQESNGKLIRPKVIVSTATVRRAESQISALFARQAVEVFPPPGPDRRDSFFAMTLPSNIKNARRYVGIAAQGRSLKVVLLRSYLALLAAAQKAYLADGGGKNPKNAADPYISLLGYFNSLRELGGSRRIVEDEVNSRLTSYAKRLRVGEEQGSFANRKIAYEVVELTSRVKTNLVAEAKRRLALSFYMDKHVDVALASNMISVGLDITRLGLMVVLGQPKMTAEYIQATSRVGRDDEKPGLVVTLLNIHRPRDRSHYERFEAYHASFYRSVEATSVTPFSPRAIDRGIAAVIVSLARQGWNPLTAPLNASGITAQRPSLTFVGETMARRVESFDPQLSAVERTTLRRKLEGRTQDLLDEWSKIAETKRSSGSGLQYNENEAGGAPPLLFDPLDPELAKQPGGAANYKFKATRSLRGVEPNVNLWVKQLNGIEVEQEEDDE